MTKAAVATAVGSPLEIMDLDLADAQAGEVRIQLGASGVCHSDLSVTNGTLPLALPAVLGHEGAGTVVQVGEGVDHLKVGDHIVVSWVPQCGACYTCLHDQGEICEVGSVAAMSGGLLDMTSRFSRDGAPIFQMAASGTFSEETVIPAIGAVKVDQSIPIDAAALIGCGVLTGFGAAVNTASIRKGDTVAVIGCGGVGLNVIQGAKHAGAERIIAVDMVDGKLARAEKFGATDLVNAGEGDAVAAVMGLSDGRGADVAFEVIGLGPTIEQTFAMTRRGGQAIIVGVPGFDVTWTISPAMDLLFQEKQIRGSWYGGSNVHRDVPKLAKLYTEGTLLLDELISQEISLDQVNEALDVMGSGEIARSVIKYARAALRYRRFGTSELEVSEVGFGTWTLASDWWGHIENKQEMLHAALDAGINFIDTAPVYGDDGIGESLLADVLKANRDEIILTTKCGYDNDAARMFPGQSERPQDWNPSSIRLQLEGSLRRLGTDYVDLYQLHNARIEPVLDDALWEVLFALKDEGKVRELGVALGPAIGWVEEGLESIRRRDIASLQTVFNIIEQEPGITFANEIAARGAGIGMIARVPHASDTLSGKVTRDTVFPPEDHRSHRNRDNMLDNFDKADTLAFLWEGTGRTRGQAAIAGILANPAFTTVLPTNVDLDDIREYAEATEMPLTADEVSQLDEMWRENFGVTNRYEMPMKASH